MPNTIKYKTGNLTGSLQKSNVALGVTSKGPTSTTGFYAGAGSPPSGKYFIYKVDVSNPPKLYAPASNTELINFVKNEGATGANTGSAAAALSWISTQTNLIAANLEYEGIVTDGLVLNSDAGFVGSYPTTGSTIYDLSGNSYNGTLTNGPTFNSSNSGSIVFDGTNDYVSLGSSVPTNLQIGQNDFTIDFWVYPSNTSAYSICGNLQDSNGTGYYWVIINSTFTGLHTVQFGTEPVPACKFGTTALAANQWYNIILSRTGTSLICYINGSVYGNTANLPTFNGTTSTEFLIGISKSSGNYSAYPLNGRLANLKIYNQKGFTSAEALQNYNAQKGRYGL